MADKPYINPAWTSEREPQPNINLEKGATELRQTLGSGKIAEIFKRGARHQPICPSCGLEVEPGRRGQVRRLGTTPYERVLILSGHEEEIVYHSDCHAPDEKTLLERVLKI